MRLVTLQAFSDELVKLQETVPLAKTGQYRA